VAKVYHDEVLGEKCFESLSILIDEGTAAEWSIVIAHKMAEDHNPEVQDSRQKMDSHFVLGNVGRGGWS
jgi:hypothetical protein